MRLLGTAIFALCTVTAHGQAMDDYAAAYFYQLEPMEAQQLEVYQEQRGIAVGISRLDEEEQIKLLGDEVDNAKVFRVIVTNKSPVRILAMGREMQAKGNTSVMTPMNLPEIVIAADPPNASTGQAIANAGLGILTLGVHTAIRHVAEGDTNRQVRISYLESTLHEKLLGQQVLEPGTSYQGLAVFDEDDWEKAGVSRIEISVQNLVRLTYLGFAFPLSQ